MNAQKSSNENLNIKEFGQLIFSADESLPVNLSLHKTTNKELELNLTRQLLSTQALKKIDIASQSPEYLEKIRLRNRWRVCI